MIPAWLPQRLALGETVLQGHAFRDVGAIDFERFAFTLKSREQPQIVERGGDKRGVRVVGSPMVVLVKSTKEKRSHTVVEQHLGT
jgi:hypothetical protein